MSDGSQATEAPHSVVEPLRAAGADVTILPVEGSAFDPEKEILWLSKLHAAQTAIEAVEKASKNSHQHYSYASAEAILLESRRAYLPAGLVVFPSASGIANAKELGMDSDHVTPRYRVYDKDTAYFKEFECLFPIVPVRGKGADKEQATARTTCMAYFLRDLLMIPRCGEHEMDKDTIKISVMW